MLKLYQFPRPKNSLSHSHYCTKLELYLKMAQIPYENIYTLDFSRNPKKQMPYIELDNIILGDSSFIIDKLVSKFGDKVDFWLTAEQKAVAKSFQRLLENHLSIIMMYFRWVYPQGWKQFKEIIFAKAPKIVKFLVANRLGKKISRRLEQQAAIRTFSIDELLNRAQVDLDALSDYLGDKPYIFGDKPSSLDALLFGVFGTIVFVNINTPLKELAGKYPNLKRHSENMLKRYYA